MITFHPSGYWKSIYLFSLSASIIQFPQRFRAFVKMLCVISTAPFKSLSSISEDFTVTSQFITKQQHYNTPILTIWTESIQNMLLQKQFRKINKKSGPVWVEEKQDAEKSRQLSKHSRSTSNTRKFSDHKLFLPKQTQDKSLTKIQPQTPKTISRRKISHNKLKEKESSELKKKSKSIGLFVAASPEPPRKISITEGIKKLLGLIQGKDVNNEKLDYVKLFFKGNTRPKPKSVSEISDIKDKPLTQFGDTDSRADESDQLKASSTSQAFYKCQPRKLSSQQIRNKFKKSVLLAHSNFGRSQKNQPTFSQYPQFPQFPNYTHRRGSASREQRHRPYSSPFGHNRTLKTKFILPYEHKSQKGYAWFTQTRIIFKHEIDNTTLKLELLYFLNSKSEKITINVTSFEVIALCEQLENIEATDLEKFQQILINLTRRDRQEQKVPQILNLQSRPHQVSANKCSLILTQLPNVQSQQQKIKLYVQALLVEEVQNKKKIINKFNREIRKLYTHQSQKVSKIIGVENGALQNSTKSRTLYWFSQNNLDHQYVFKQALVLFVRHTATFVYRAMPISDNPPRNLLMKKIQVYYRQCNNLITDKINLMACLFSKLSEEHRLRQSVLEYDIVVEKDKFQISKVLFDNSKFVGKNQPKIYFNEPDRQRIFQLHYQYQYSFFKLKSCEIFRLQGRNIVIKGTQIRVQTPNQMMFLNLGDWQDRWTFERFAILKILNFQNRQLMKRLVVLFVQQVKNLNLVNQIEQHTQNFHHMKVIEGKKYCVITTISHLQKTIECRFISVYNRLIKYRYKWTISDFEWSIDCIKKNKLIYFSNDMSFQTKLSLIYNRLVRDSSLTYSHLRLPFTSVPDRLIFARKTVNQRISTKFCTKINHNTYIVWGYVYNRASRAQYFHLYMPRCQKNYTRIKEQKQGQNTQGIIDEVQTQFSTKKSLMKIRDMPHDLPSFKRKKLVRREGIRNGSIRSSLTTLDQRIKENCFWRHFRICNQNYFIIASVNRPLMAQTNTDNTELQIEISCVNSMTMFKWLGSLVDVLRNTLIKEEDLGKKMICTRRSVSYIAERLINILAKNNGFSSKCRWEFMQLLENDRQDIAPKQYRMYLTGQVLSIRIKQPVEICLLQQWQIAKDLTRNRTLTDITNTIQPSLCENTQKRLFRRLYNRVKWYKQIGHI